VDQNRPVHGGTGLDCLEHQGGRADAKHQGPRRRREPRALQGRKNTSRLS
jgi:hypothetical protein